MSLPAPAPGLVIRYSYLWRGEADEGREEGSKDRPCAVLLTVETNDEETRVYVLPITHSRPNVADAIEIPQAIQRRLKLDDGPSWIILEEMNVFAWPGPDLRSIPGIKPSSVAYGFLPPRFFRVVRDRFLALDTKRRAARVIRSE